MDNQGELHKYFVIVFEKAWNANLYKCAIQEQLWTLFKLRNVYFVLSKLKLNCYKMAWVCHIFSGWSRYFLGRRRYKRLDHGGRRSLHNDDDKFHASCFLRFGSPFLCWCGQNSNLFHHCAFFLHCCSWFDGLNVMGRLGHAPRGLLLPAKSDTLPLGVASPIS